MINYKQHNQELINEAIPVNASAEILNEVAIQFGSKSETQFGQVVILAGGAGSGKGFILDTLLDIQGKVFDVDALKQLAIRAPKLNAAVKAEFGTDLSKLNLKNPDDVFKLHAIVDDLGLDKGKKKAMMKSIASANANRKPNLIFDVTLKNLSKLKSISEMVKAVGYLPENIHIVWILNDINVAIHQNMTRSRRVPDDILKDTHDHVSKAMSNILKGASPARNYMDGYFIIVPNKVNVDSSLKTSGTGNNKNHKLGLTGRGGMYLDKADYIVVKKKKSGFATSKTLSDQIIHKIKQYVPNPKDWGWWDES